MEKKTAEMIIKLKRAGISNDDIAELTGASIKDIEAIKVMNTGRKEYLYPRVSTKKQKDDGNSLEDQSEKLKAKYPNGLLFPEQYTGTKKDRPKFNEILKLVKPGDVVAVTKLDRLARNLEEGLKIISELKNKGVAIDILNMGVIDDTIIGKLIVQVLLAFAEFERDMIVERMQAGRAYAREHKEGYKDGRKSKINPQKEKFVMSLLEQGYSYRQIEEEYGIKRGLVYKIKKLDDARKLEETLKETIEDAIMNDFDYDDDEIVDFD